MCPPHRLRIRYVSVQIIVYLLCAGSNANDFANASEEDRFTLAGKVVQAKNAPAMRRAFRSIYSKLDDTEVARLRFDHNWSISLQSSWEIVQRTRPGDGEQDWKPTIQIERFISFCEGKLGVSVPTWWQDELKEMSFRDGKLNLQKPDVVKRLAYCNELNLFTNKEWLIKRNGDEQVQFTLKQISFATNIQSIIDACQEDLVEAMCVSTGKDHGCFVFYNFLGGTCPMLCVDLKTGKLEWTSVTWGGASRHIGGSGLPSPASFMEPVVSNNAVWIFGRREDSIFIEGFSLADGSCLCRFSNTY